MAEHELARVVFWPLFVVLVVQAVAAVVVVQLECVQQKVPTAGEYPEQHQVPQGGRGDPPELERLALIQVGEGVVVGQHHHREVDCGPGPEEARVAEEVREEVGDVQPAAGAIRRIRYGRVGAPLLRRLHWLGVGCRFGGFGRHRWPGSGWRRGEAEACTGRRRCLRTPRRAKF
eukprot:SAG31_NODE_49_length_30599_cov_15.615016_33_plen_174_part_00